MAATAVAGAAQTVAGLVLGHPTSSAAVLVFVLESAVRTCAWVIVFWSLSGAPAPAREQRALRALAAAFALAGLVGLASAGHELSAGVGPAVSAPAEAAVAGAGALVMAGLALAKRDQVERLGGAAVGADATKTALYSLQSAAVFLDLALQQIGLSTRIDAAAAAFVGVIALLEAWRARTEAAALSP